MKTRIVLLSAVSSFVAFSAFAQAVESDDMYFNKKDRVKLNAQRPVEEAYIPYSKNKDVYQNTEPVYASAAGYSARNVNPEFAARSNAQAAQTDNQDYFVANYQYNNAPANNLDQFNNNLNNWYNNPMYNTAYMGSRLNGWSNPYYGMYSMYNSPWYNPYSNNGFSSSFGFYFGNSYNYGWGGNYNYWNQPYCGGSSWGAYYGSGYGGYNNYYNGYGNYGYWNSPNVIIINNGESSGRGVTYGKRPTSGGGIVSGQPNTGRTRSNIVATNNGGSRPSNTGGRTTSSASTQQSAYYNRSWRDTQQMQSNYNNSNNSSNRNWSSQQNSSADFNRTNNTRSSSFDGGGNSGGTRTQSAPSTGSGSNGRTRGRD